MRVHYDPIPYNMYAVYTSEGTKKTASMNQFGVSLVGMIGGGD